MSSRFSCSVQLCRPEASPYSFACSLNNVHRPRDRYPPTPISTDTNPIITSMKRSSKHQSITEACSLITSSFDSIVNWHEEQGEDTGKSSWQQNTSLIQQHNAESESLLKFFQSIYTSTDMFFLEEKETLLAICVREGLYESPPRLQRRDHELLFYTSSVLDEYIGSWMGP